ncbi:hypothetical protein [Asticcacaulis sp. AND118]|uniref:hypothetical protein n=1 Tax=Asticcacaulis sp. AND118 TaxID=2840468 RepID=UPI001CFFD034|nr:hypothetical protein [Asticcacaulis sp. AND118]UDF04123.1 hypothetical protein LH365_03515 [Asticcacaulis sp. AND118]
MKKALAAVCALGLALSAPAFAGEGDKTKMVEDHLKKMDTNGDGMVSMEEHRAAADKMFMEADTNGDKMISKEEMIAYKAKEKAKAGH